MADNPMGSCMNLKKLCLCRALGVFHLKCDVNMFLDV